MVRAAVPALARRGSSSIGAASMVPAVAKKPRREQFGAMDGVFDFTNCNALPGISGVYGKSSGGG